MTFKSIYSLILFIFLFASCTLNNTPPAPRSGDLIFISDVRTDFSKAIDNVTQHQNAYSYTHVGIIENRNDTIYMIHASPKNGVEIVLLSEYVCQNNANNTYHLYRIKEKEIDFDKVLNKAKSYLGMPYNSSFILSDTSQYCSELIFNAFEGYDLFSVEPMSFKDPQTGKTDTTWEKYFAERNEDVPEGSLGCNPNGLSKNKKIKIISRATCSDVMNLQFYTVNEKEIAQAE